MKLNAMAILENLFFGRKVRDQRPVTAPEILRLLCDVGRSGDGTAEEGERSSATEDKLHNVEYTGDNEYLGLSLIHI